MKTFIYVTGGKGGIGKSTETIALVDYLSSNGDAVLLLDADPVNADSSAAFKNGKQANVACERVRVRSEDADGQIDASGLMSVLDMAHESKAMHTVVDAPAGETTLLVEAGSIIVEGCKSVKMKSVIVWMVDSVDRTAVNALAAAWESIKDADTIVIVKNHRKGNNFDCFEDSKTIAPILNCANVKVIDMPKIAARLEPMLKVDRKSFKEIAEESAMGSRMEAIRVRKIFHDSFKEAGL